ncbi:MAG TPA: hypothetical protein VGD17_07720 [Chitinophagaceae bacterium]
MNQITITHHPVTRFAIISTGVFLSLTMLFSFTISSLRDDVLKQLGLTKTTAEERMKSSILDGSIDTYGLKNPKAILIASRPAITKELMTYTKEYVQSPAFKKQYEALKLQNKPPLQKTETPEEMKAKNIAIIRKSIAETEASLKKADASMKPVFEKILAEGNKQLAAAQDPNNKQYVRYANGYPQLVKDTEQRNQQLLKNWESKYPSDDLQFVKRRLQEFLEVTNDIDFKAQLVNKNGKQIFANPEYEKKDYRWKMAFRAGKEVIEPARAFVQQWLVEIK